MLHTMAVQVGALLHTTTVQAEAMLPAIPVQAELHSTMTATGGGATAAPWGTTAACESKEGEKSHHSTAKHHDSQRRGCHCSTVRHHIS